MKQPLNEEFRRMQKLAGINEGLFDWGKKKPEPAKKEEKPKTPEEIAKDKYETEQYLKKERAFRAKYEPRSTSRYSATDKYGEEYGNNYTLPSGHRVSAANEGVMRHSDIVKLASYMDARNFIKYLDDHDISYDFDGSLTNPNDGLVNIEVEGMNDGEAILFADGEYQGGNS